MRAQTQYPPFRFCGLEDFSVELPVLVCIIHMGRVSVTVWGGRAKADSKFKESYLLHLHS